MKDIGFTGLVESDKNHIEDIIKAKKGDMKFSPLMGVGIHRYIKSRNNQLNIIQDVRINLEYDKASNISVSFINNEVFINATY